MACLTHRCFASPTRLYVVTVLWRQMHYPDDILEATTISVEKRLWDRPWRP